MSLLGQTLILYLLTGAAVAVAVYLRAEAVGRLERGFRVATAVVFWPLYVPLLLTRPGHERRPGPGTPAEAPHDDLAVALAQTEAELEAALAGAEGWADSAVAREGDRLRRLPAVWLQQAACIRAMDQLLALPKAESASCNDAIVLPELIGEVHVSGVSERLRRSQEVRRQNRERLRRVRQSAFDEFMSTLACVRELVSMLHLARFTGAPPARAEELLGQIVASSEGLAAITWQEESSAVSGGST